jgi:hypothetical protein
LFSGSKPDTATLVSELLASIKENDPVAALAHADKLAQTPKLSKKQNEILTRIHMCLVEAANAAAEKGDQRAVEEMNYRRQTK